MKMPFVCPAKCPCIRFYQLFTSGTSCPIFSCGAAPSSHVELLGSLAVPWASTADGQGWKAMKGCRWGSCCPISWWSQPPVACLDIKKCDAPVIDVSICHCSMNWGSLGCTRLAQTRQATQSLVFPFQIFTSAGMLKTCRGSRCCGVCICLLQLAADILWCFTSEFPSAAEPEGVTGVLKYSCLLQGQGHTRGTLRNQKESPRSKVSDCAGPKQCCPRNAMIALVLLDADPWLWLEPAAWEQTRKGHFCRVRWGNSSSSPAEPGTWLRVSFSCQILEKALTRFPSGNHCPALPQALLLWTQVWYSPATSPW